MRLNLILILFLMVSNIIAQQSAQYIGHRGCRGVYPENTIEGLKKAIQYGADGIEWDVVINKDDEIIISHEPYIDTTYCQLKDGVDDPKKNNIYKMSTGEIKAFDCGSKFNMRFPNQQKITETKPTLKEAEKALLNYEGIILFEIKSKPSLVNEFYPEPKKYARIIYNHVKTSPLKANYIYMSFDPELLNQLHLSLIHI
mgnify:FL=1